MKQYRVEKLQSYLSEYQKRQFKSEYSRFMKNLSANDKALFQQELSNKKKFDKEMDKVTKEETTKQGKSWRLLLVPKTAYYDASQYTPFVDLNEQIKEGTIMKKRSLTWRMWRDWFYWVERLVLIVLGGVAALMFKPFALIVIDFLK